MLPALQNDRNGCHLLTWRQADLCHSGRCADTGDSIVGCDWLNQHMKLAHCPKAHDQVPD